MVDRYLKTLKMRLSSLGKPSVKAGIYQRLRRKFDADAATLGMEF
jgi:hypothetical protein